MEELIADFGYIAIFIGTFLEGETVLALGGVAAAHGYLSVTMVISVAIVGGFLGDQTCFWIGRRYGARVLERYPGLAAKAPRVQELVRRWDAMAVILLRFCYGLRIAGPIVIGSCGISPWRLALFNFIGVVIWAPLVAAVGYLAWYAIEQWIGRLKHVQIALLMALVLAVIIWWIVAQLRRRSSDG
jgi:membrane protein DedA with SNARE-associated domain